jgi:lipoprotein-anchoring transpeptidase ErfK/SrfK
MEMTGWGMFRNCVVTVTLAALVAAGCGGTTQSPPRSSAPGPPVQRCAAGTRSLAGSSTVAWAANVQRPTTAFRVPGGAAIERFGVVNVNKAAMVLGVLGERVDARCRVTWLHVSLPIRPNGVTGWVRAANVVRTRVHTRITVDLSERRVTLYRDGRLVLAAPAAIGSSATPTPLGRYYVNQRLIPDDPSGPYGPGAVGISAFSPVLTGWTQGGPIAIHGTNEPWSIGRAVSNGCIRIPNALLRKLFPLAVEGTPVLIKR